MIIIDGKDKILGRLASYVAKKLLLGEQVVIVNAQDVLIKRDPKKALDQYLQKIHRGNPYSGPFFPKRADLILRRTIRGMLPYKRERGKKAFKRLKVYIGVPDEFKNVNFTDVPEAKYDHSYKAISLGELSKSLGAKYYE